MSVLNENRLGFLRELKLVPAIGDWTRIRIDPNDLGEIKISEIQKPGFDSLSEEDIRYLHYFHYRFSEHLFKQLGDDLNLKIDFHSIAVEQLSAQDFLSKHSNLAVQGQLIIKSVGVVNLILNANFSRFLLSRLTGGDLFLDERVSYTDLELLILKTQLNEITPLYVSMWKDIFKKEHLIWDVNYGAYSLDPRVSPAHSLVAFNVDFSLGKNSMHRFSMVYPNYVVRRLLRFKRQLEDPIKHRISLFPKTKKHIKVPLRVTLGKTSVSMFDLKNLQVGDIVTLDSKLSDPVEIMFNNSVTLYGQPGVVGNRLSVQLIEKADSSLSLSVSGEGLIAEDKEDAFFSDQKGKDLVTLSPFELIDKEEGGNELVDASVSITDEAVSDEGEIDVKEETVVDDFVDEDVSIAADDNEIDSDQDVFSEEEDASADDEVVEDAVSDEGDDELLTTDDDDEILDDEGLDTVLEEPMDADDEEEPLADDEVVEDTLADDEGDDELLTTDDDDEILDDDEVVEDAAADEGEDPLADDGVLEDAAADEEEEPLADDEVVEDAVSDEGDDEFTDDDDEILDDEGLDTALEEPMDADDEVVEDVEESEEAADDEVVDDDVEDSEDLPSILDDDEDLADDGEAEEEDVLNEIEDLGAGLADVQVEEDVIESELEDVLLQDDVVDSASESEVVQEFTDEKTDSDEKEIDDFSWDDLK